MKKFRKIFLVLLLAAISGGIYTWFFVYNKPHPNYENLKADYHYETMSLFNEYRSDKASADDKCTGKMISISGNIDHVEKHDLHTIVVFVFDQGIFGEEGIRCTMLENYRAAAGALLTGTPVEIKGFCTGYNETDVVLDKCTINTI